MCGGSGRSVRSSDSPMFAFSGYKGNVDAAVVYGQSFSLCIWDNRCDPGLLQLVGNLAL